MTSALERRFDPLHAKARDVVERRLGRALKTGEVVHHVDRNPRNERASNLRVFTSRKAHLLQTEPALKRYRYKPKKGTLLHGGTHAS